MKLEQQVVSLELSKKLYQELGFEQESYFQWSHTPAHGWKVRIKGVYGNHNLPAYTVAELGEMLPKRITFQESFYFFTMWKRENGFATQYKPNAGQNYFPAQIEYTEADARASMLVYLIENDLITPKDLTPPT